MHRQKNVLKKFVRLCVCAREICKVMFCHLKYNNRHFSNALIRNCYKKILITPM